MNNKLPQANRSRGVYLLPNLFTTGGLFAGFYAIVAAMLGDFEHASFAIFIAMGLDTLDGRVARMTNTTSAFGAEYDSLADMVSFGIAPALVLYSWALTDLGKFGWLVAFLYTATTALRLARFNAQLTVSDKRYFKGLPCPAAAGIVAGLVGMGFAYGSVSHALGIMIGILAIVVSLLMISHFRFYSFKDLDFRGKVPFIAVFAIVLMFVTISLDPLKVLFGLFFIYALSGPTWWLWRWFRIKKVKMH